MIEDYIYPSSSSSSPVFIRCCPLSRNGRIRPILSAIARTPFLHLPQFRAFSTLKPLFSVSSSTCFFQVFFGRPRFLLPLTSRSRAILKTLPSSLLSTCPHHLTPFTVANWSTGLLSHPVVVIKTAQKLHDARKPEESMLNQMHGFPKD